MKDLVWRMAASSLSGKVALITGKLEFWKNDWGACEWWNLGSTSGIGAATAKLFNRLGATLVLTGRQVDRLQQVAAECDQENTSKHSKTVFIPADVAIEADIESLVQKAYEAHKRIDILVR